jgi:hypothetical protein
LAAQNATLQAAPTLQTTNQAISAARGGTIGDQDFSNVEGFRNFQYGGPEQIQDVQGYNTVAGDATRAANLATFLGSGAAGQNEALKDLFYRPDYTRGQTSIDRLLLQRDPTAVAQARLAASRG